MITEPKKDKRRVPSFYPGRKRVYVLIEPIVVKEGSRRSEENQQHLQR